LIAMRARKFSRNPPAWWLLVAALAIACLQGRPSAGANPAPKSGQATAAAAQKEKGTAAPETGLPARPKSAAAFRNQWSPAFSKPVPTSIADLRSIEKHVESLLARISPSVVAVEVGYGSGSGVVISEDGLVLTAGHVCGSPNRSVRFMFPDGKIARGKTLGADSETDCGLMRITDRGPWPYAPMGDLERAAAGDWVLALGHPGGFDVKRSLVVRLGRIIRLMPEALQTDCTISPGDSGGPLFDMQGRVIGIHTAISGSTADNFHVAIGRYFDSWDELTGAARKIEAPAPPRAYVGASGVDSAPGCRLTSVEKDGPAAKAGLKVGDVVLKVDDREITASASFRRWVAEATPGETLKLQVKRGERLLNLAVKIEAPPRRN
jgi:serine protease Do